MADFDIAMLGISQAEGGWSSDVDDAGGETIFGIARNFFPGWQGWTLVDQRKTKKEKEALLHVPAMYGMVMDFYRIHFWNRLRGDAIHDSLQDIAGELMDVGVNAGVHTAVTFLQRALNVLNRNETGIMKYNDLLVDGVLGNVTLETLNSYYYRGADEIALLYKVMNILQGMKYIESMEKNHRQEKYARGWFGRVNIAKG